MPPRSTNGKPKTRIPVIAPLPVLKIYILSSNTTKVVAGSHPERYSLVKRSSAPLESLVKITLIRTLAVAGMLALSTAAHASPLADLLIYLLKGGVK